MELPVLRSKLVRPNLAANLLPRLRLEGALAQHADRPLTLVVADAGYGKTTLLASFVSRLRRPVVWYSLMLSDADPVVFGRHLLAGFRAGAPRFGRDFERALAEEIRGPAAAERLAGVLLAELATLEGAPTLLVLDDFHEVIGNATIVQLVGTVLRQLPPQLRVLIGSRVPPPLPLERMRVRSEVFELDSTHLRFTSEELARLFSEVYRRPLGPSDLAALEEPTLGWPTAVHLVHESLRRDPARTLEEVLGELRGSNLDLRDFLSSEVHSRLAPDEQRLLERVAAVQRFDVGLAAELSGIQDAAAILRRLSRRGLVRSFGSAGEASYELHDLVRGFLRARLFDEGGAVAWTRLEADTARVLASRGESERALRHFLTAGRVDEACALAAGVAPGLLREGRAATLLQYLGDLPLERIRANPDLLVSLADARQSLGQWDEAETLYREALALDGDGANARKCRALLGLSKVLNMRGRHEEVLRMAEKGLGMVEDQDVELRIRLLQRKAGAHFYLGQSHVAVSILDEVRRLLPRLGDTDLALPTIHNLAMAYAAMGRYREASRELEAALAQVRGTPTPRAPLYLSNLALLLSSLGELADARAAAEEGLEAARRFHNRAQEITCREALAQILAQSGDLDAALAALRVAEELNREQRMEVISGDLLALRGRIFCARGQYRRAVDFLSQAIERLGQSGDRPRRIEFQALLAWCELRSGRPRVARDLLLEVSPRAEAGENDFERMRVAYWLAEAHLALGERDAVRAPLERALGLVRERGYRYFLAVQAREDSALLLHALESAIEVGVVAAALVEAGPPVEAALVERLAAGSDSVGEAAAAALAELGGRLSLARLPKIAASRRTLAPAIKTALRLIEGRVERGAAKAKSGDAQVRLTLFGAPRLEVDGRLVPASAWRAQRAFQMLVYLTLHSRGATRDGLLEAFWPGRQLAAGRRNFHPTLSYIRSVLPEAAESPLLREGERYRLHPQYPMSCDVWEVERLLEEARHAEDDAARRRALEEATTIGALPLLDGLYADWAVEAQSRMRDAMERALVQCGDLCMKAGDFEIALNHFRRAAELDGFRETTRVAIVECLVRGGNRRAAIVEYERLNRLLRDELDVAPLPETQAKVAALLGRRDSGDGFLDEAEDDESQ